MDLIETLRTTGAVRDFHPEPVADDVVSRILDTARFGPSGGNRQGWHVVVVKDAATRSAIRDAYLPAWRSYLAQRAAGLTPWAPITDRAKEAEAVAGGDAAALGGDFSPPPHQGPGVLVVFVDLRAPAALGRDPPRYTLARGAP